MRQVADDETPPPGSELSPADWSARVPIARNLNEEGTPAIVGERCGDLELEWVVEEGTPVHLWRITVAAQTPTRVHALLDRFLRSELAPSPGRGLSLVFLVPFVVALVAAAMLVRGLDGNLSSNTAEAVIAAVAVLVAAAVMSVARARNRRVWRELELGAAGDLPAAYDAQQWLAIYAHARRAGDEATAAQAHRVLWERGTPVPNPRPR